MGAESAAERIAAFIAPGKAEHGAALAALTEIRSREGCAAARALLEVGTHLAITAPGVSDSGEGRWTVQEAIDLNVPAPVIALSLMARLRSRDEESYADRMLAALRNQFGGHAVKHEES
jgi:6-phosphogluconate dehydrogenase (decarboxylating)